MEQVDDKGLTTTLIHYVFQVNPERIACMPRMTEFHRTSHHPHYERTNAAQAVTCPACKKTEVWKKSNG